MIIYNTVNGIINSIVSHQHNILCDLARKSRKYQVFYCTPAFTEIYELEKYHIDREVAVHSAFISCNSLPKISSYEKHNICYTINPMKSIMHSEFRETNMDIGWQELLERSMNYRYENVNEFILSMAEQFDFLLDKKNNRSNLDIISDFFTKKGIHLLLLKIRK